MSLYHKIGVKIEFVTAKAALLDFGGGVGRAERGLFCFLQVCFH